MRKELENPNCPIGKPIGSERARELNAMRRTFGVGTGKRFERDPHQPRCACGAMTLKRALTRGHDCTAESESQEAHT